VVSYESDERLLQCVLQCVAVCCSALQSVAVRVMRVMKDLGVYVYLL